MPPQTKRHTVRYIIVLVILLMVGFGAFSVFHSKSALVQSLLPVAPPDNRPSANEQIEILGPVPEANQVNIKSLSDHGNGNMVPLYFSPSGDAVAYGTPVGESNFVKDPWYYVKEGQVNGPVTKSYLEEQMVSGQNVFGLNSIEREDTKNNHTLKILHTGSKFSCIDSSTESQNAVMYNGQEVGVETIQDGHCAPPVEGVLLSDDGLHYAYIVRAKRGYFVLVDGKRSENYPMVRHLHFEGGSLMFNTVSTDFSSFLRIRIN